MYVNSPEVSVPRRIWSPLTLMQLMTSPPIRSKSSVTGLNRFTPCSETATVSPSPVRARPVMKFCVRERGFPGSCAYRFHSPVRRLTKYRPFSVEIQTLWPAAMKSER